jgi:hypothetical protein
MIFKNIKIEHILLSVLLGGLFLVGFNFLKQLSFPDNSRTIKKGERIELSVGDSLKQKIIAKDNGLSKIEILFGNKKLKKNYSLKFILADKDCQKIIRQKILPGEYNFNSKYLYDFNFSKIKDSKNKNYCLRIEYLSRLKKEQIDPKNKIRIFTQGESEKRSGGVGIKTIDPGITGNLMINSEGGQEKIKLQDISFRTSYQGASIFQSLQQLNQRISQYKPWFLKAGYLKILLFLTLIISSYSVQLLFKNK